MRPRRVRRFLPKGMYVLPDSDSIVTVFITVFTRFARRRRTTCSNFMRYCVRLSHLFPDHHLSGSARATGVALILTGWHAADSDFASSQPADGDFDGVSSRCRHTLCESVAVVIVDGGVGPLSTFVTKKTSSRKIKAAMTGQKPKATDRNPHAR